MRQLILDSAIQIATRKGLSGITREAVAAKAGSADSTVSYHFKTMAKLKDLVVSESIRLGYIAVIAKALAEGHRLAKAAPKELKDKAAAFLTK